ncbi:hypothetical protein M426DRAFT_320480 [Hypoxylon sp. CI-4A]|nr:hypothetical protein M426DRAFT_320480 [Hypoxylon sp. CI-4A]
MSAPSFSITLEEHAAFPSLGTGGKFYEDIWSLFPEAKQGALDHTDGRIASMDEGHISYQIMSHLPGIGNNNPEGCRGANNEMAEAIKKNPTRLAGFAVLPMAHPEKAAAELERTVKEFGFLGALIDSHLEDMTHFDDERFWPVFEAAERLDVPIYIHPAPPADDYVKSRYAGNYPRLVTTMLAVGAWGWHEDVGLHVLKLYLAGLFDRYPKLKIVIGHFGEMLPIMIDRADSSLAFNRKNWKSSLREVWDRNIWVTSSGVYGGARTLEMLLKVTKKDRILYSIDTPFVKNIKGWEYLQELVKESSLSKEELDDFAYKNARKLFKLEDVVLKKF